MSVLCNAQKKMSTGILKNQLLSPLSENNEILENKTKEKTMIPLQAVIRG